MGIMRTVARAIAIVVATLFFAVSVMVLLPGVVWLLDAKYLPGFARAWLIIVTVIAVVLGIVTWLVRKFVGRTGFIIAVSLTAGAVIGLGLPLAFTYRNSCSAIGWHYEQDPDLQLPWIVWREGWDCSKSLKYRRFKGVWVFGEMESRFQPVPANLDTPPGRLSIDGAAANFVFDRMLHFRPGREDTEVYIEFDGNAVVQGRSDAAHSEVVYRVRDVKAARLIRSDALSR